MSEQIDINEMLWRRLMEDLDASKEDMDPKDRKLLSEEIKSITSYLSNQDNINLEWEKLCYQKHRDLVEDKHRKVDRFLDIGKEGLKFVGGTIPLVVAYVLIKSGYMVEFKNEFIGSPVLKRLLEKTTGLLF